MTKDGHALPLLFSKQNLDICVDWDICVEEYATDKSLIDFCDMYVSMILLCI